MSEVDLCPRCKQPLPSSLREGVYLPSKKARIYDIVQRHPGITTDGIIADLDDGSSRVNIRTHIYQINEMLAGTEVQISGDEPGERGCYRIVRRPMREVA